MCWSQSSPGSAPGGLELPWALGGTCAGCAFEAGSLAIGAPCLLSQKPSLRAPASDRGLGASSGCSTLGCWGGPISLQGLACWQLTHPSQRVRGGADQPASQGALGPLPELQPWGSEPCLYSLRASISVKVKAMRFQCTGLNIVEEKCGFTTTPRPPPGSSPQLSSHYLIFFIKSPRPTIIHFYLVLNAPFSLQDNN